MMYYLFLLVLCIYNIHTAYGVNDSRLVSRAAIAKTGENDPVFVKSLARIFSSYGSEKLE